MINCVIDKITLYKRLLPAVFCMAVAILPVYGQTKDDMCGWINADIIMKHNNWSYVTGLEYRTNDNISRSQLYSFSLFIRNQVTPRLRLSGGYEFYGNKNGSHVDIDHRLLLQGEYSYALGKLEFNNRLSVLDNFEKITNPDWGIRDRVKLGYHLDKLSPYMYVEIYCGCNSMKMNYQKTRYASGLSYDINKKNNLNLYYMLEDFNKKPLRQHIIGVSFSRVVNI